MVLVRFFVILTCFVAYSPSQANDCKYGLGASVWTQNLSRAHRIAAAIEAGICWVNTAHRNDPSSPWYACSPSLVLIL